jgi:hypothetical protein
MKEKIFDLDQHLVRALPCFQEVLSLKVEDESYLKQDAQMKKILTFEALRDLFARISEDQPLVLVIEDLHWIDKISEDFINYLIGWLANTKIHLILLYRPEYIHQWGSKSYYAKIGLGQLNLDSAKELVKAMLEGGEVAPELRELILSRSAGNPLFMEEFIQTLLENGSIQKKENQYILDRDISDIQVPDTIQGIISARIDRLEDNLKRTLQVASVIGRDFAFRILQSITGMREELKSYLLNLQGLEFIYEKKLFPELEYIFKHALIQEVAYNSLLQARRKEIHQKIAEAIEQVYSDRIEEFYEMLAYHYSASDYQKKAIQYLELSAKKASDRYAYNEAVQLLEQAKSAQDILDPEDKDKKLDILILLGDALINAGNPRQFLDDESQQAFSIAESLDDKKRAAKVCRLAMIALEFYGWGPAFGAAEAAEWAERADRSAQSGTLERVWADIGLGFTGWSRYDGTHESYIHYFERALSLARNIGDPETFWQAAGAWLFIVWTSRYAADQKKLVDELLEATRDGVSIRTLFNTLANQANVYLGLGKRKDFENIKGECQTIATRTGQKQIEIGVFMFNAVIELLDGHLEQAVEECNTMWALGEESDLAGFTSVALLCVLPKTLAMLGKTSNLIKKARQKSVAETITMAEQIINLIVSGNASEASQLIQRYLLHRKSIGEDKDEAQPWLDIILLHVIVLYGFPRNVEYIELMEFLYGRLKNSHLRTTGVWFTTSTSLQLGRAAAVLGKFEDARNHFQDAIKVCTEMPFRPDLALSKFGLAELLLEHFPEERTEAQEHLNFAIAEFREMKMKPWLQKALELQNSLGK